MESENDELSCDVNQFYQQLKDKKRIAVTFIAKDFPATENYIEALGRAYEEGYFGEMEMAIIPVDSQECDTLAEHEKVAVLPSTCVYSYGKPLSCISPTDEDAKNQYKKTIEKLIDLSED